jgi:predicted acylesterase/phospholipase RssA
LQMGDIAHSVCASCTLPGIFQPMEWGHRQLVDGGIINIVPGNVARAAGVDVVIGIDMRATRHIFSAWQMNLKRVLDTIKQYLWPSPVNFLWEKLASLLDYSEANTLQVKSAYPNIFTVLDKSIGLAIKAQRELNDENFECDLLIAPDTSQMPFWKRYLFLHFTDFSNTQAYYKTGRRTAQNYLPQLWQLLADHELKVSKQNEKLESLMKNN